MTTTFAHLARAAAVIARRACAAAIAFALSLPLSLSKGSAQTYHDAGGTAVPGVVVVDPTDNSGPLFTASNPGRISGTFSGTLSGFQPTPAYATPLSVGATSWRVALPSGTVVVVYNTGSFAAYVTLGNSSVTATASDDVIQPNSWMAFTVGANTYLAAIETAGATSLNISGGAGLPTGGGGGSVPTGSAGSPNANVVTVQGVGGATGVPVTGAFWQTTQPVSLASLPALASGSNTIGAVTQGGTWTVQPGNAQNTTPWLIDETTASQLHADLTAALPAGANTIGKVDVLGNAGATLDTAAGTSAAQALGVQGVTGGVAVQVSGTFWQTTQPVSLASLPALAAGSNTIGAVTLLGSSGAAMDTTPGGAAAANALQVQGVTGMQALLVNPGTQTNFGVGATGSSVPAKAVLSGAESSGNLTGIIQADNSVAINVSTAATTQLVALSSGKKIYVVSYEVVAGGTGNITFEYGTGTSCSTGTTALTGAIPLVANTRAHQGGGLGPALVVPAGNALCVVNSAAVQMSGSVAYTQF